MSDSQTLKNVIEHLINTRKIKNESDFCAKTGFQSASLSKIKNGDRNIPPGLKLKMIDIFSVSQDYLSNGSGPIVKEVPSLEPVAKEKFIPPSETLLQTIDILGKTIDRQDNEIQRLEKANQHYIRIIEDYSRILNEALDGKKVAKTG